MELSRFWDPELVGSALIIAAAVLSYFIVRSVLIRIVHRIALKTSTDWDDVLIRHKVFEIPAYIAPVMVLYSGAAMYRWLQMEFVLRILHLCLTLIVLVLLNRLLSAALDIYNRHPISAKRSIKGYVQLVRIFLAIVGATVILALLVGVSPWKLVSGIGALTAVLLLIFKDTILSLVASIQIAGNDLLHQGDWIEMPQFNADGEVVDIALHTVKVQNWDKTIVSIPTSKFLEHSFKNWRGMQESGGRRIKRAVFIDQSSIRFMDGELLERVKKIAVLKEFFAAREAEASTHGALPGPEANDAVKGQGVTNIEALRAYVKHYLKAHPGIRQNMTQLVRHLPPRADSGLPLEIYAFTTMTEWGAYEEIQADIFDHILAIIPQFGLRAYQRNALVDNRC